MIRHHVSFLCLTPARGHVRCPGAAADRAQLAQMAAQLRLPSLLLFFSPAHSHLSREQCSSLAQSQSQQASMGSLALSFAGEVQSKARDEEAGSSAQPATSAAARAAPAAAAEGAPNTNRSRVELGNTA